jgi:Lon protease-like protein
MSLNYGDYLLPEGFSNVVRLFPLPNLVLFPGVVQALHLFEPRYRALMADALAADELITMAFLKPDWQAEIAERPAIAKTVCIGKILSHTELDDGRYNLFLVGAKRARIVKELSRDKPYRMAKVEILEDFDDGASDIPSLRAKIVAEFRNLAGFRSSWNPEAMDQFVNDDLPFGHLVDMICYSCGALPDQQQAVLETSELGRRGEMVRQLLREQIESKQTESTRTQEFPPGFSLN